MNRKVYADNAATTAVSPQVLEAMLPFYKEVYGNPSSLYALGQEAKRPLEEARATVARCLGAEPREIYFTSCGTESDNWAIKGAARAMKRKGKNHIITSAFEHHAVLHTCQALEKEGFTVTYLDVHEDGIVRPQELEEAITEETGLVTIMYANNEIGTIQPIPEIGAICKAHGVLFHTDAVQAVGNVSIDVKEQNIDMLSLSGHKLHAPKGVGALYVKKTTRLLPRTLGGGQERGLRSGTESVPLIGALGEAVRLLPPAGEALEHIQKLNSLLRQELAQLPGVVLHSPEDALPYVLNFSAGKVRGETMLHFLAQREVYVSSGSACGKAKPSHVLESMGLPKEQVQSALRVSFSRFSTEEDVGALVEGLKEGLAQLAVGS